MSSSGSRQLKQVNPSKSGDSKGGQSHDIKGNKGGEGSPGVSAELIALKAIFYTPDQVNKAHWALATYDEDRDIWDIFQVIRKRDSDLFKRNHVQKDPKNSGRHFYNHELGMVDRNRFQDITDAINSVPITDVATDWTCQDYVMEAHTELEARQLIHRNEKDKTYAELYEELYKMFGPNPVYPWNKTKEEDEDTGEDEQRFKQRNLFY